MRNRRGPKGVQSGSGSRSRSSSVPNCTVAPGRASTSSSFHSNCSASPLTTVTFKSPKASGSTEAAVPTTSTRAAGVASQQAGHHRALQRQRQERRIEDVQIGAARAAGPRHTRRGVPGGRRSPPGRQTAAPPAGDRGCRNGGSPGCGSVPSPTYWPMPKPPARQRSFRVSQRTTCMGGRGLGIRD